LSIENRRTKLVFSAMEKLVAGGRAEIRPGDITAALRESGTPMLAWEVRGVLSELETEDLIRLDAASGAWLLAEEASRKAG